jgi:hypothetical protein
LLGYDYKPNLQQHSLQRQWQLNIVTISNSDAEVSLAHSFPARPLMAECCDGTGKMIDGIGLLNQHRWPKGVSRVYRPVIHQIY